MNHEIREFTDGVLTNAARLVVKRSADIENKDKSWIMCDGDIDPEWIGKIFYIRIPKLCVRR